MGKAKTTLSQVCSVIEDFEKLYSTKLKADWPG